MGMSCVDDSGGENSFDNPSQSRYRNQQAFRIQPKFEFKKPRSSEWNSYHKIPLSFNRVKLSIPYKSQLCKLFLRGKCYFGENCHYAHKTSEIRKSGFNLNEDSERNDMCRDRLCYYSSSGQDCPYGDRCNFLHRCYENVKSDGGLYGEGSAVNGRSGIRGSDQIERRSLNDADGHDKFSSYKTKLCVTWERFGSCRRGAKCTYAHGEAELQEWGHFAKPEQDRVCRLMLDVQPNNAAPSEVGIKIAEKLRTKGKRCFMKWDIEKISQIYADWIETDNIPSKVGN